ncbi:Division abnormally delayed protein [Eumeta japonica]|uniref:Division abnormally delayed protein n=1 Tax=Eumeta variegata TaxID=151549 RepID=A0A4C1VNZ9_EUMVA|nr:Division abnormally delayed protein [Eumeta japonica]
MKAKPAPPAPPAARRYRRAAPHRHNREGRDLPFGVQLLRTAHGTEVPARLAGGRSRARAPAKRATPSNVNVSASRRHGRLLSYFGSQGSPSPTRTTLSLDEYSPRFGNATHGRGFAARALDAGKSPSVPASALDSQSRRGNDSGFRLAGAHVVTQLTLYMKTIRGSGMQRKKCDVWRSRCYIIRFELNNGAGFIKNKVTSIRDGLDVNPESHRLGCSSRRPSVRSICLENNEALFQWLIFERAPPAGGKRRAGGFSVSRCVGAAAGARDARASRECAPECVDGMRWSVVFAALWAGAAACGVAERHLAVYNVTGQPDDDFTDTLCGGQCCGRRREGALRAAVGARLARRAAAAARPLADLLLSTRASLQEHLTALSQQSQNKTALIFAQVYKGQATRTHGPLEALYEDIRVVLLIGTGGGDEIGAPSPRDLSAAVRRFFREVFSVAYHDVLKLENKQFTPEYDVCLRDAYDAVQPFGQVPQQLGTTLSKSMEAARALLQALALGAAALASAEQLIGKHDVCATALTRVAVCARCRGLDARPCRNYCLNVVRGCIGASVSELDAPWAAYVEGVEKAARGEVDAALRTLDARITEAIMHALENHSTMEKKRFPTKLYRVFAQPARSGAIIEHPLSLLYGVWKARARRPCVPRRE